MGNSVGMFGHLVSFCLLNLWHCGSCVYAARCCPDGFPYLCSWSFFSREVQTFNFRHKAAKPAARDNRQLNHQLLRSNLQLNRQLVRAKHQRNHQLEVQLAPSPSLISYVQVQPALCLDDSYISKSSQLQAQLHPGLASSRSSSLLAYLALSLPSSQPSSPQVWLALGLVRSRSSQCQVQLALSLARSNS